MPRLVKLTDVSSDFHANVIKARLLSEGIFSVVKQNFGGPYPLNTFSEIWVEHDQYMLAREVLLGDAVDEIFLNGSHQSDSKSQITRQNKILFIIGIVIIALLIALILL